MSAVGDAYALVLDRKPTTTWLMVLSAEILLGLCIMVFPSYLILGFMGCLLFIFITMRNLFYGYVLFLILLPFWTVSLSQFFQRVDLRASDLIALVVLLCFVLKGLVAKKLLAQPNPIAGILSLFLSWITLSFLWNVNFIWGLLQWGKVAFAAVIFVITYNIIDNRSKLDFVMKLTVAISVVFALIGIYHFLVVGTQIVGKYAAEESVEWGLKQGGLRASPFQAHAHKYGAMMNYGIVMAITLFLTGKSKATKICSALSLPLMLTAVALSFSRLSYVALFVVLSIFCFTNKAARKGLVFGAVLTIVIVAAYGPLRRTVVQRTVELISPDEGMEVGRPLVYEAGLKIFADYPIAGVGVGSFPIVSANYGAKNLVAPHNIIIYILAEYGVIGMLLFTGVIGILIRRGVVVSGRIKDSYEKQILFGFFVGLVMYMVQMMADSYRLGEVVLWVALGFTISAMNIFPRSDGGERHAGRPA